MQSTCNRVHLPVMLFVSSQHVFYGQPILRLASGLQCIVVAYTYCFVWSAVSTKSTVSCQRIKTVSLRERFCRAGHAPNFWRRVSATFWELSRVALLCHCIICLGMAHVGVLQNCGKLVWYCQSSPRPTHNPTL